MYRTGWVILFACFSLTAGAQTINNTYTYREMKRDRYFRFLYENDYFTATDKFYTQGIYAGYAAPWMGKLPSRHILLHPGGYSTYYGLALQHNAYTPQNIDDAFIRYGDRPYAAALMLQFYSVANSSVKRQRFTTMLSTGVTGHIAGGEWLQKTIHKATANGQPMGWQYQVANDVVLNYKLQFEKSIARAGRILLINGTGSVDAGTLLDKISAGGNIMLGYFDDPYDKEKKMWFSVWLYTHAQVHAIGYDATMQGTFFNQDSPYTIAVSDIDRVVADNRYGIVFRIGAIQLEYFRYNISREFRTGTSHAWGGVQLGVDL